MLEKRREIRQLQEQNAALTREIEHRRDRIRRLEDSRSEQEMEIRKQLKLLRPGETTFILPDGPKDPEAGTRPRMNAASNALRHFSSRKFPTNIASIPDE